MDAGEARSRLGLGNDASPAAVMHAHHRLTLHAIELPPELRANLLRGLDEARDTLIGISQPPNPNPLDVLATPRGMAALAAAGVVLTALPLLTNASLGLIGALAPVVLASAFVLSLRGRKVVLSIALAIAVIASVGVAARNSTNPGTQEFAFDGDLLAPDKDSPFAGHAGVPLTTDPSTGVVDDWLIGEPATLVVSCVTRGKFQRQEADVYWGYVADGDYETYWVPLPYLAGVRPGAARTLKDCSDWRWQLWNFGGP